MIGLADTATGEVDAGQLYGFQGEVISNASGAGVTNLAVGGAMRSSNGGTGRITTNYGMRIFSGLNYGGGSISSNYGLRIDDQTAGFNNWAIYTGAGRVRLGGTLETRAGRIKNTTRVTTTYTILVSDEVVFCNTSGGAFTATLPLGVEGQTFKIINSGSSGNKLTVAPNGSEHLIGANSSFDLNDGETLQLTYNSTDGWY
jgi:hypothetical protein